MAVEFDKISTRNAFGEAMFEAAKDDESIVFIAADTLKNVGGTPLHEYDPKRSINVGIAEQNMALMGAGMATCGAKVFLGTYAPFASMRICEQVRSFIAYPNLDVKVIAGMTGVSAGEEGVTHQGTEDVNIMRSIPNMVVVVACDAASTKAITREITKYKGPCYLGLGKGPSPKVFDDTYHFEIGKANIMKAEGTDAAIICNGPVVRRCILAEKALRDAGYSVKLIEMPCIKPIDEETIKWAMKECSVLVTVEDHNIIGGLGGAVAEVMSESGERAILKRIGIEDIYTQTGDLEELLDAYGMREDEIAETVKKAIDSYR